MLYLRVNLSTKNLKRHLKQFLGEITICRRTVFVLFVFLINLTVVNGLISFVLNRPLWNYK